MKKIINVSDEYNLIWYTLKGDVASIRRKDGRDTKKKDVSTKIDMFTERQILVERQTCMQYDKNYADKRLVQKYNEIIAPDIGIEGRISQKDMEAVFYADHLAVGYGLIEELSMVDGVEINLRHQIYTRIFLLPIFEKARKAIRDEIIRTTKAFPSADNEYILEF